MSTVADQIAEVLKAHIWYFVGNLGVPGMPDRHGYKCGCGWETRDDHGQALADPHAHVAQKIIELFTEEVSVRVGGLSGAVMSPHDVQPHHTVIARRYVSSWQGEGDHQ